MSRPTKETDAYVELLLSNPPDPSFFDDDEVLIPADFARTLERQRDELVEALQATLGHSHEDWPCQICENSRKALATKEGGV